MPNDNASSSFPATSLTNVGTSAGAVVFQPHFVPSADAALSQAEPSPATASSVAQLRDEAAAMRLLPRAVVTKRGEPILLHLLDEEFAPRLIDMYLAYAPRNSFQGLPPIKDDACIRWVEGMVADAVNVVALSFQQGIAGHAAIFPIDASTCEMLVVVSPAFQNVGIGTELTRAVIQIAHATDFDRVWLDVDSTNVRARHVYKKCGFEYLSAQRGRELEMAVDLSRYRRAIDATAGRIMQTQVATIGPDASCREALSSLLSRKVASLPVVESDGRLVGLLSQNDLLQPLNLDKQVRDIFSRHVPTVRPDCCLAKLVRMFQSGKQRSLPVVDAQRTLLGIVGRSDLLTYYAQRLA
jgi:CBS-domain-containing membrane protein